MGAGAINLAGGGFLVASPDAVVALETNPCDGFAIPSEWGIDDSGVVLYMQAWTLEAQAPGGFSGSNGLEIQIPGSPLLGCGGEARCSRAARLAPFVGGERRPVLGRLSAGSRVGALHPTFNKEEPGSRACENAVIPSHDSLDLLRSLAPDGEGPGRGELVARLAEHVARRQSQGVLDRDAAGEWGAALVELVAGGATDPAFDWLAVARALAARGERRAEDGLLELADLLFDARIQPRNSYQVAAYVRDLIRDGHPRLASLHEEARPNDPSGVTRFVSERGRWARPASEHPAAVSWSRAIEGLDEVACRAEVRALRAALEARYLAGFPMVDLDPRTPTFSGEYTEATAALLADQLARVAPAALERGFLFLRGMKNLGSDLDYLYVGPGRGAWTPLLDERMRALGYCVDVHQRERVAAQLESGELSQYSRCYLMQLDFCAGDAQAHRHFVETTLAGYALERDRGGARFGERVLNSQAERMERFVDLVNESAQRPTSVKAVCLRALEDYLLALRCEAEVLDCGDAAVAIRSLLCAGAIAAEEARFLMETYDLILWTRNALHYQKGCNSNVLGREVLRPACEFFGVDAERLLERLAGRGRELARRADHFSKHKAA